MAVLDMDHTVLPDFLALTIQFACRDLDSCSQLEIPPVEIQANMLEMYKSILEAYPDAEGSIREVAWVLIFHHKLELLERMTEALNQYYDSLTTLRAIVQINLL